MRDARGRGRAVLPRTAGCPSCSTRRSAPSPLDAPDVSERRRRARLVKPQLAEGPLVKVAWVRNQAEGEFLQSLLLEQGVPSLLRRTAGFDVPDMLFAGPRDVLVAASGLQTARETLLEAGLTGGGGASARRARSCDPGRCSRGCWSRWSSAPP